MVGVHESPRRQHASPTSGRRTVTPRRTTCAASASATRAGDAAARCGRSSTPTSTGASPSSYVPSTTRRVPFRIATGPNVEDYNWTEVMMREAGRMIDGLDLHYYTVVGSWAHKGSATQFGEREWFLAMKARAPYGGTRDAPRGDHGQVRPAQARRAHRRRVGHVARRRSRAPIRASSTSRTRCATRSSRRSRSTSSTITPIACEARTSRRW